MPSRFKLDKPKTEPIRFDYRGLVFWLKPDMRLNNYYKIRNERMVEADVGYLESLPQIDQRRWCGMAMFEAFVHDIEPFEIEDDDGNVSVFECNEDSAMAFYKTNGEELLGENEYIQDDLFEKIYTVINEKPDYEVRALGKSLTPSDSGGKSPQEN